MLSNMVQSRIAFLWLFNPATSLWLPQIHIFSYPPLISYYRTCLGVRLIIPLNISSHGGHKANKSYFRLNAILFTSSMCSVEKKVSDYCFIQCSSNMTTKDIWNRLHAEHHLRQSHHHTELKLHRSKNSVILIDVEWYLQYMYFLYARK